MRRPIRHLLWVLVAGLGLNAVLCLGLSATHDPWHGLGSGNEVETIGPVSISREIVFGMEFVEITERPSRSPGNLPTPSELLELLPSWLEFTNPSAESLGASGETSHTYMAVGYPFRAFWAQTGVFPVAGDSLRSRGCLQIPPWLVANADFRLLPLRPIWTGLALNVFLYGVILLLALRLWTGIRELRRYRNGACASCGHDLQGDYTRTCAECGWRSRRATD